MSTDQDYQVAEQLLRRPARPGELIVGDKIRPQWIDGGARFWYGVSTGTGKRFVMVDTAAGTREPAFDHGRLAAGLAAACGQQVDSEALPFPAIELAGNAVEFAAFGEYWRCGLDSYVCERAEFTPPGSPLEVPSPDRKVAVSRRGHDLWARSLSDGREWALTTDGEPDYQYGTGPDCTSNSTLLRKIGLPYLPPAVAWSPDSTRVLVHRTDERGVRQTQLVEARPADGGAPVLRTQRYAYAGDENTPRAELVVLDVAAGTVVRAQAEPLLMPVLSPIVSKWAWWAEDGSAVYYLSQPRDRRTLTLHRLNPATGEVTTVLSETGATRVEPNQWMYEPPIVRVLAGEVLWYSQRDGWGHLYRYDLRTGELLGQVTSGQWAVRKILHVDEAERVVYFMASGLVEEDPYRRTVCRVGLDGSGFAKVTDDELDHIVTLSDTMEYFIDSASTVDTPPVSRVRDWSGRVLVELERADISKLTAIGWTPPERFRVKAADGVSDIYGVLYRPRGFDPARRYPVVDNVYPGPQVTRVEPGFDPGGMGLDAEPIAVLGFVVVAMDGRGTPGRSKAFHDASHGHLATRAAWPTMSRRYGNWRKPGRGWIWTGWARSATPAAGSPPYGRCWTFPRCTRPASPSPAHTTPATSTRASWRPTTARTTRRPGPVHPMWTSPTGWWASCCSSTAAWTTRSTRTTRCGWPSGSSPPTRTSSCSSCPGPSTRSSTACTTSASATQRIGRLATVSPEGQVQIVSWGLDGPRASRTVRKLDRMIIRPAAAADLDRVLTWTVEAPVSWVAGDMYRAEAAEQRHRPEWTWIAEDETGRMLARAVWWGRTGNERPAVLDCLSVAESVVDRVAVAAGLLDTAHAAFGTLPMYQIKLATGWADDPRAVAAVAWRREAAYAAGLTDEVQRLQYEWSPSDGVPEPSGRLVFTPEPDDAVMLDMFRRIAAGSLDAETRTHLAAVGAETTARKELAYYLDAPGDRDWWRLAHTPDGQLAGLAIPSATPYGPNVGYLGVLPELRGNGYVDDILAEVTRLHAERGATRITATTDLGNAPMAAAFGRAGYRNVEARIILSAPTVPDAGE